MTVLTDLKAVSNNATAVAAAQKKGVDLTSLVLAAERTVFELQIQLKSVLAVYPSTGGDAANYAAITAVLAELA